MCVHARWLQERVLIFFFGWKEKQLHVRMHNSCFLRFNQDPACRRDTSIGAPPRATSTAPSLRATVVVAETAKPNRSIVAATIVFVVHRDAPPALVLPVIFVQIEASCVAVSLVCPLVAIRKR